MAYSDKVIDHYNNPRNVGQMDKSSSEVGTGLVGAPECGDVMRLQIRVNPETQVIEEAKFKTFGCGSAIASSSLATEWVKGKTVEEAMQIKNTDIVKELALPPVKIHCSVLAEDAIRAAIGDWKKKNGVTETAESRKRRCSTKAGMAGAIGSRCSFGDADRMISADAVQNGGSAAPKQKGLQVTERALKRIRVAMAKEGVSPEEGGLRLGIQGGGCSGLSYNIRFDSQPRERDRVYKFEECASLSTQVVYLPPRHDSRLRRDADAAGIQLHQSPFDQVVRLRLIVFGLGHIPNANLQNRNSCAGRVLVLRRTEFRTGSFSALVAARYNPLCGSGLLSTCSVFRGKLDH